MGSSLYKCISERLLRQSPAECENLGIFGFLFDGQSGCLYDNEATIGLGPQLGS